MLEAAGVEYVRQLGVRINQLESVDGAGRDIAIVAERSHSLCPSHLWCSFDPRVQRDPGTVKVLMSQTMFVRMR